METILIALITGVGSALISGLLVRKKNNAEATEIITRTAMSLIQPLENKVRKLERKVTRYGERILYLTDGIGILVDQIINDGKQPCWEPDKWEPEKEEESSR